MEAQMVTYYSKDGIIVRDSIENDADYLADHLRESDVREIWASHHHTSREALFSSMACLICLTVEVNGEPVAMFGINAVELVGTKAIIWLLASDKLDAIQRRFLRHCRSFIEMFLAYYPLLFNFVDARNEASIKWLKWCGADIEEAAPYGAEGLPFHYFEFRRKNDV